MKQLLAIPLLAVWFTLFSGCGDPVATPVPAQIDRATGRKPVESPDTTTVASTRDEKKSELPPANEGHKADAAPVAEPSPAGETAKAPPDPAESSAPTKAAAPARSNEVHKISFDDLNCGMQADIVFRPWMLTDRVKELDGQRVRIVGYMHPDVKQQGINEFILLRNTECKFGPTGQADHLIRVTLEPGITTNFSSKPVQVIGKLILNPFTGPDGKTWCIFDMTGQSVGAPQR